VEIWTPVCLARYYVLFFVDLSSRRIYIAGVTEYPDDHWMQQIARNLTDEFDGFLKAANYLIIDRDPLYTKASRTSLADSGVKPVRLPPRSPNLNAYAERFVRTIKESCLNRMILFGEKSLRRTMDEFVEFYHHERNYQGLDNGIIEPRDEIGKTDGSIECRERPGGVLRYYCRQAA
jgi:putative transposase